jgi:hypothetical protein
VILCVMNIALPCAGSYQAKTAISKPKLARHGCNRSCDFSIAA